MMGLEPTTFCMARASDVCARSRPCAQPAYCVREIRWLGVATERVAEMHDFRDRRPWFAGGRRDSDYFVELAMADGSRLELFGNASAADGPWLFEKQSGRCRLPCA